MPANVTMPMRTSAGWSLTNSFAAACAATMRDGSMSPARMLSETSIDRMIVRCSDGSVTIAVGRANGDDAGRHRREHQRRREVAADALPGTDRAAHERHVRIADGALLAPPQHEHVQPDQHRDDEQEPQRERREEIMDRRPRRPHGVLRTATPRGRDPL